MVWKIVRYTVAGQQVAGIGTVASYVSLFFNRGVELDDPDGLLEGSGKVMRFTRLRSPADAERPAIKRLMKQAVRLAAD